MSIKAVALQIGYGLIGIGGVCLFWGGAVTLLFVTVKYAPWLLVVLVVVALAYSVGEPVQHHFERFGR